jgi:hypothetical protein
MAKGNLFTDQPAKTAAWPVNGCRFDGIGFHPSQGLWFVKDRFVNAQFNRYGNQELMNVGKTLDGQKFPSGRQMSDPIQINKWIGSDESNTANTILIFRKEHGAQRASTVSSSAISICRRRSRIRTERQPERCERLYS